MPSVPEAAFRSLLADRTAAEFRAFVADLWRARGHDVRREGDLLVADDETLYPTTVPPEDATVPGGARPVVTADPPDWMDDAVGPADLHGMLLYDVGRDRAAALFEDQFDRPLEDDWDVPGDGSAHAAGDDGDGGPPGRLRTARSWAAAALARGRAALGDRRVQAVVLAVMLVLAAGTTVAVTYEPAPERPSDPPFAAAGQSAPVDGSYRVTATVQFADPGGSSTRYEFRRTYAPGDPAVAAEVVGYGSEGRWSTTTTYEQGERSYTRWSWTNETRYEQFRDSADLSGRNYALDATRSVYTTREGSEVGPTRTPGLVAVTLGSLPYERQGTTTYRGRDAVRYVPTDGWVTFSSSSSPRRDSTNRSRHVSDASGEVLVDADTGRLLYADVDAESVRGRTWAAVVTDESVRTSVTYSVATGVDRPAAPPWVDGLRRVNGSG
jgi:hypothetical protein